MIKKLMLSALLPVSLLLPATKQPVPASLPALTAGQLVQRIQSKLTCEWADETVDTYKSGEPQMEITGVATTFLATLEVLKKAKAKGLNFIITHEPTFYNHLDLTDQYGDNSMIAAKQKYIEDNGLIVWRFHDHWHRTDPDGIYKGVVAKLGWESYERTRRPYVYKLPVMKLKKLSKLLKKKFEHSTIRVVGDPEMEITNVGMVLGAAGSNAQIKTLELDTVEALIIGETHEWETVEYVRDAVNMGKKKALIMLGHANSEEAGMAYCANWLKTFVSEVPVEFIPAGDPFWSPGTK